MATEEKTEKAEAKQLEVADNDPVPYFRIGSQAFHSGMMTHEPGEIIPWSVPDGWKTERHGKHYAAHFPSMTWEPLNKAARKLMAEYKEEIAKRSRPRPDPQVERLARLEELQTKMLEAQQEQTDALLLLLEKLAGKK